MKHLTLFLLFLPLSVYSQFNKNEIARKLAEADSLCREALFTESAEVCEKTLSNFSDKKTKGLRADLLTIYAKDLYRLHRNEEAISALKEAEDIVQKIDTENSIRQLRILNLFSKTYFWMNDCENMKHSLDEALLLFEDKTTDNELAETYDYYGSYWGEMGDTEKAGAFFEKAKNIRLKNVENDPLPLYQSALFLSRVASFKGEYDDALKISEDALSIIEKNNGNYFDKQKVLLSIGICHEGKGDYETALQYYSEGLTVLEKHPENALFGLVNFLQSMATVHRRKHDFERSELLFEQALEKLSCLDNTSLLFQKGAILHDYALLRANQGDYATADSLLSISINTFEGISQNCNWNTVQMNQAFATEALFKYNMGDYQSAIKSYQKAIKKTSSDLGPYSPFLNEPLNNIGLTFNAISQYDSADVYYSKALKILERNNHGQLDFSKVARPIGYSYIVWNKAENHYWKYKETSNPQSLEKAFYFFDLYVQFLDYLRSSYRSEATKIGFAAENKIAYEKCIETLTALHKIKPVGDFEKKIFNYIEKSKALVLLEAVKRSRPIFFENMSENISLVDDSLRQEAASAENRYFNYLTKFGESSPETKEAKSALFEQKIKYGKFVEKLKSEHNDYYRLKYSPTVVGLEKIKSRLGENKCLLHFYEGDENIYLFFISNNKSELITVKRDFPLTEWVLAFRTGIQGYHTLEVGKRTDELYRQNLKKYITASTALYGKLIAPISHLIDGYEKIIIIPDGQLANLPFEALLSGQPKSVANFSSYPFLVYDHVFSYCYSATLLQEMEEKTYTENTSKKLIALAPFAPSGNMDKVAARRSAKGTLAYSGEEAIAVASQWGGEHVLGQRANKAYFLGNCGNFSILHLSTHGTADAEDGTRSFLEFGRTGDETGADRLYVREIYNITCHSDMVVLSACETNIGELKIGEGIISVARAFIYAGTKSILATLWQVEDLSTKNMMVNFYRHLPETGKDRSLQLAKLEILQGENTDRKHPYFWAGMIAIGDMSVLKKP